MPQGMICKILSGEGNASMVSSGSVSLYGSVFYHFRGHFNEVFFMMFLEMKSGRPNLRIGI
ncbi:MAG: hypothetical protein ACRECH_07560 [Nitrososphaerales archaeon]